MQLSVAIEALVFDHGYANWLQMPNTSLWKSVHLPKFHAEFIRNVARIFNFALLFPTWVKLSLCLSNEMLSRVQGASLSVLIRAADRWCSLGTASKEKPWPWGDQLCFRSNCPSGLNSAPSACWPLSPIYILTLLLVTFHCSWLTVHVLLYYFVSNLARQECSCSRSAGWVTADPEVPCGTSQQGFLVQCRMGRLRRSWETDEGRSFL